jgi:hypothetical protein
MNLTELLVTAYSGDEAVFTADLMSMSAATILIKTDSDGETAVEACAERATPVFASIAEMLKELTVVAR